jgi:hypothetical protein
MKKKIKPFLEEYSSLEKIASFMINKIDNDDIYGDQFSYYKTSIILLKLTNSPHFSERAKSYQHILKDYVEWQQEQFKKLIEYLETI